MTAMNGVGLALVMPAAQSLIADLYKAKQRGRAFGCIMTVAALGELLPSMRCDWPAAL